MARSYLVFADIEGKLDVLRVECTKCDRKGLYLVRKLIEKYGRKGNLMKWREMLNADCPKRDAHSLHERCDGAPGPADFDRVPQALVHNLKSAACSNPRCLM